NPGAATWGGFSAATSAIATGTGTVAVGAADFTGDATTDLVRSLGSGAAELLIKGTSTFGAPSKIGQLTLNLPAGKYVRIAGTAAVVLPNGHRLGAGPFVKFVGVNVQLAFGGAGGPKITANFSVSSATNAAGQKKTIIAVTGGKVTIAGSDLLKDVNGIFVLT